MQDNMKTITFENLKNHLFGWNMPAIDQVYGKCKPVALLNA